MSKTALPKPVAETAYTYSKYFQIAEAIETIVDDLDYKLILGQEIDLHPWAVKQTKHLFRKTCWIAYERKGIAEYTCFRAEYNPRQKTLKVFLNSENGWKLKTTAHFIGNGLILFQ